MKAAKIVRIYQRQLNELRPLQFQRSFTKYAEGSVLVTMGETRVLCNASIVEGVPRFLKHTDRGWLTAEYGMLPRATHDRMERESTKGKQSGRTIEIQRLVGRVLRTTIDLHQLGPYTIVVDCDVIQADGGTRSAAINGACLAVLDALQRGEALGKFKKGLFRHKVAAVSLGICQGQMMLDLDYQEDSSADVDLTIVMTEGGSLVEIQGAAEKQAFTEEQLVSLLKMAKIGIKQILEKQAVA